jgi:hypothetical protein
MIATTKALGNGLEVPIDAINLDFSTQMRAVKIDQATVEEYASDMEDGDEFPAVTLFFDGETYHIGDGFHRVEAARKIKRQTILADVQKGNQRDAKLRAMGANASHGLRRTNEDKRNAVETILRDPEWSKWPARQIAEACDVSHTFINKVKNQLTSGIVSKRGNDSTPKVETIPPAEPGSVSTLLASGLPDDVLFAECERRGWEVSR